MKRKGRLRACVCEDAAETGLGPWLNSPPPLFQPLLPASSGAKPAGSGHRPGRFRRQAQAGTAMPPHASKVMLPGSGIGVILNTQSLVGSEAYNADALDEPLWLWPLLIADRR